MWKFEAIEKKKKKSAKEENEVDAILLVSPYVYRIVFFFRFLSMIIFLINSDEIFFFNVWRM